MAKTVPKQTLEEIRFRNEISELLSSYMTLQRAGTNFKALCPFHKEKTPSFSINTQRQIYHCFGCGAGGDVFGFMMQHEGVDFMTAVSMLADRAGIPLALEEGEADGPDKRTLYRIHEEISRFFQRCLLEVPGAQHARDYLKERGLDGKPAEDFLIGYAPNSWDATVRWGEKNKHKIEDLEACGLVIASDRENARSKYYDRFRDRLMFPIHDTQGRVIGFSGRVLQSSDKGAKYVNSPETPLFRKSRVLYGLHRARKPIVEVREAILCEGQIDVIRCHQAGFETAVASQGTAFTEEHARALRHYADSVVLLFDADTAGQDAAMKTAATLIEAEYAVRVARMPPGHDPDTLIRDQGADALRSIINNAGSSVAFQIEILSEREREKGSGGAGRMRVASAVLATIARCKKEVQKEQLLHEAAERLNVSVEALRADMHTVKLPRRAPQPEEQGQHQAPNASAAPLRAGATTRVSGEAFALAAPPGAEVALCEHLARMAESPELLREVRRYLPLDLLTDPDCRRLAAACIKSAETGQDAMQVLGEIGEMSESLQRLAASALNAPAKVKGDTFSTTDAVRDLVLDLWRRRLRARREELYAKPALEMTPGDQACLAQLTQDIIALRNWTDGCEAIQLILEDSTTETHSENADF